MVNSGILNDFPDQIFEIRKDTWKWQKTVSLEFYVYCSETMGKNFRTYKILKKWISFNRFKFIVYGLTKVEITNIQKHL